MAAFDRLIQNQKLVLLLILLERRKKKGLTGTNQKKKKILGEEDFPRKTLKRQNVS